MSELAEVHVTRDASSVCALVTGEVDASNAEVVRVELETAVAPPRFSLDLSRLDYLDSAGVRAIFAVAETAATRATELTIVVRPGSPIRRVLDVAGVASVVPIELDDGTGSSAP